MRAVKYSLSRGSRPSRRRPLILLVVLVAATSTVSFRQRAGEYKPADPAVITAQLSTNAAQETVPRLIIPSLNLSAFIENVGVTPTGNMDVPKRLANAGWYQDGPQPGETGNAVIAGHLGGPRGGSSAVFWNLQELETGDEIYVIAADRQKIKFIVESKESYMVDDAPLARIFGAADSKNLNLITCRGAWDNHNKTYDQRLVVYAKLAED